MLYVTEGSLLLQISAAAKLGVVASALHVASNCSDFPVLLSFLGARADSQRKCAARQVLTLHQTLIVCANKGAQKADGNFCMVVGKTEYNTRSSAPPPSALVRALLLSRLRAVCELAAARAVRPVHVLFGLRVGGHVRGDPPGRAGQALRVRVEPDQDVLEGLLG